MLGTVDPQAELLDAESVVGHLVDDGSIYRQLAEIGDKLFTDDDFADLYDGSRGRRSVPPSQVAKVLLLQSLEGTSDRETMDRVRCDIRWKVALGLSLTDAGFHPTVLCYFRERLRNSTRPRRLFERFKEVATEAGLLSRRGVRVLDSTPVLSAVQTQDTVTLIRGGVRRLLRTLERAAPADARRVEEALGRDDYAAVGKPPIDWEDPEARAALVDELVRDALVALETLEGTDLPEDAREAAELLATVAGQDVEAGDDGRFRIRRGVAKDRVVSTVDPEARHGRKSRHGHFDGYKAHVACEPESELITEVVVTPANTHDAEPTTELLPELEGEVPVEDEETATDTEPVGGDVEGKIGVEGDEDPALTVVADKAYGSAATRRTLQARRVETVIKAPPEVNSTGGFPKSAFDVDLDAGTAACPAGVTTSAWKANSKGTVRFRFPKAACADCSLRERCTSSPRGRSLTVSRDEELLAEARSRQRTEGFLAVYNGVRPTVERVISRLTRRGGRKARYRGTERVAAQFSLKATAENLARMLNLGLHWHPEGRWAVT